MRRPRSGTVIARRHFNTPCHHPAHWSPAETGAAGPATSTHTSPSLNMAVLSSHPEPEPHVLTGSCPCRVPRRTLLTAIHLWHLPIRRPVGIWQFPKGVIALDWIPGRIYLYLSLYFPIMFSINSHVPQSFRCRTSFISFLPTMTA